MKFYQIEIPIAVSMVELAEQAQHPFQKYFAYWAAFNNIYVVIGNQHGLAVQPNLDRKKNPKFEKKWGYTFPKVIIPGEPRQILETINQLDTQTKENLIKHPNVTFFVHRMPTGVSSNHDARGQLINGVLNITRTIDLLSPIWSPINITAYESYLAGNIIDQTTLTEQVVFMLYTIRNNLVHGSKNMNEANDIEVVVMALPLLEIVVKSFIRT